MWLESLEGGLEYLKQVVIEDSLGICEELETQMSQLVDRYQCEWKTTLADPIAMARFKSFVNTDESDTNIVFVKEREQIRPAREDEKIAVIVEP